MIVKQMVETLTPHLIGHLVQPSFLKQFNSGPVYDVAYERTQPLMFFIF